MLRYLNTIIHITHEAAVKASGIGTVLEGILSAKTYRQATQRSIVIGPLLRHKQSKFHPFTHDGQLLYSSLHGLTDPPYKRAFEEVEEKFGVNIVYGKRFLNPADKHDPCPVEVILIEASRANENPINAFKSWLYEDFGIESNRYEHDPQYELYVRIAPAAIAVLRAMAVSSPQNPAMLVAHEYMAMPTALAGIMDPLASFKTVFYAHEVPSVRQAVEQHPGHDTMFLNAIEWAKQNNYYFDEIFGLQDNSHKHVLVSAAANCDNIIAVSPQVKDELLFLGPQFRPEQINLVYNGIPARAVTLEQKNHSKELLRRYTQNLLGFTPDVIFSHVARASISKAFWRDLNVLHHLEQEFARTDQTGVYYLLGTETFAKPNAKIVQLERTANWPVEHIVDNGDLSPAEIPIYDAVRYFNDNHQHIKAVFVNQFGWNQQLCGQRMPQEMQWEDLRVGTDVEFSLSTYEPFGIAALEPLTYGALCVTSSSCGCLSFAGAIGAKYPDAIIVADYAKLPNRLNTIKSYLAIDQQQRDQIEHEVSEQLAHTIFERLPRDDARLEKLMADGCALANKMNWETVVRDYLLPALEQAYHTRRIRQIA